MNISPIEDNLRLSVRDLGVEISSSTGPKSIVEGISFDLHKSEVFAIVGESGCGKSLTAIAMIRLLPEGLVAKGEVVLPGIGNVLTLEASDLRAVRGGQVGVVFQNSASVLSPVHTVRWHLRRALWNHHKCSRVEADAICRQLLSSVGLDDGARVLKSYSHELSGGMRQRVLIAMALIGGATTLIADEPTTALDASVRRRVLGLLENLVKSEKRSVILISHDLALVEEVSDRIAVMYAGQFVEVGEAAAIIDEPLHPYSRGLVSSTPRLGVPPKSVMAGRPPTWAEYPNGCRFAERCQYSEDRCRKEAQVIRWVSQDRSVRCWKAGEC
jgi:oligopeptide/dipeptide ABC transporter ATP-binding protein